MTELFVTGARIDWERVEKNSWLRRIPALNGLEEIPFRKNVTFLAGENGSGKSTLLEAIAVAAGFNPEGGTRNYRFCTYEETPELGQAMTLIRGYRRPATGFFFRAETFFNLATAAVREYESFENYHEKSHGEGFLSFMEGFDKAGLYLMDEPEAALSPMRQLELLRHIHTLAEAGAQFIVVTHSHFLLGLPGAEILSLSEKGLVPCAYEETESFRITEMFLRHRQTMLKELL